MQFIIDKANGTLYHNRLFANKTAYLIIKTNSNNM